MSENIETIAAVELKHGHTVVGLTRIRLTSQQYRLIKGLVIRAPGADDPVPNTGRIWIGGSAVTADSNVGTGGMPLVPGESIELPVDDPTKIYAISDIATQDVAWMGA